MPVGFVREAENNHHAQEMRPKMALDRGDQSYLTLRKTTFIDIPYIGSPATSRHLASSYYQNVNCLLLT